MRNEQIDTLWELSGEGTAEWWPDEIEPRRGLNYFPPNLGRACELYGDHALAIVRGSAERWLSDRDWECVRIAQGKGHNYWCKKDWSLKGLTSLADAIRAETNRRRT